jgi:hypothetical protein
MFGAMALLDRSSIDGEVSVLVHRKKAPTEGDLATVPDSSHASTSSLNSILKKSSSVQIKPKKRVSYVDIAAEQPLRTPLNFDDPRSPLPPASESTERAQNVNPSTFNFDIVDDAHDPNSDVRANRSGTQLQSSKQESMPSFSFVSADELGSLSSIQVGLSFFRRSFYFL